MKIIPDWPISIGAATIIVLFGFAGRRCVRAVASTALIRRRNYAPAVKPIRNIRHEPRRRLVLLEVRAQRAHSSVSCAAMGTEMGTARTRLDFQALPRWRLNSNDETAVR